MADGFVCRNDDIAIGLYVSLRQRGVRIPDDACLIGCDGMPDAEYLDVPISTIYSPVEQVCEKAWEFLKNRMADPTVARQSATVTSELRVRASSQRRASE
jgi:DNA-binding LacI/PurR family transcriptional regulator